MAQKNDKKEKIEALEDFNEQDLKEQKSKKALMALLILFLVGCVFYYYNHSTKKPQPSSTVETITVNKVSKKAHKKEIKKEMTKDNALKKQISEVKDEVEEKVAVEKEKPVLKPKADAFSASLKPTSRIELIKLAMSSKSKADPFSGNTGSVSKKTGEMPSVPFGINSKLPSILPPPPSFGDFKLPSLNPNGMPSLNKTFDFDSFDIKGFIGNKVIINVNGVDKSLKVGQSFRNIKVLKVDSPNLTAKFSKDGKIVTKNLKSLTDVEDKKKIKLVKH